jgi:LPXTG-motif cell wall-anchored protein
MPIEFLVYLLSAASLLLLGALLFGRRKRTSDAEL